MSTKNTEIGTPFSIFESYFLDNLFGGMGLIEKQIIFIKNISIIMLQLIIY